MSDEVETVDLYGGPLDGEHRVVPYGIGGIYVPLYASQAPFTEPRIYYKRELGSRFRHISRPAAEAL